MRKSAARLIVSASLVWGAIPSRAQSLPSGGAADSGLYDELMMDAASGPQAEAALGRLVEVANEALAVPETSGLPVLDMPTSSVAACAPAQSVMFSFSFFGFNDTAADGPSPVLADPPACAQPVANPLEARARAVLAGRNSIFDSVFASQPRIAEGLNSANTGALYLMLAAGWPTVRRFAELEGMRANALSSVESAETALKSAQDSLPLAGQHACAAGGLAHMALDLVATDPAAAEARMVEAEAALAQAQAHRAAAMLQLGIAAVQGALGQSRVRAFRARLVELRQP